MDGYMERVLLHVPSRQAGAWHIGKWAQSGADQRFRKGFEARPTCRWLKLQPKVEMSMGTQKRAISMGHIPP